MAYLHQHSFIHRDLKSSNGRKAESVSSCMSEELYSLCAFNFELPNLQLGCCSLLFKHYFMTSWVPMVKMMYISSAMQLFLHPHWKQR